MASLLHILRPSIAALTLLLFSALFTTSCGFVGGNAAAQGNGNNSQSLTLSGTFPGGVANQPYNAVLTVSGGNAPYQFFVKSGSLPLGMTLNPATGSVSGTPTAAGSFVFQVGVTDVPAPHQGSQNFAITVAPPNGGGGIRVTVSPSSVNVVSNQSQTFTATVTGTDNTGVSWSASAGSISNGGVYTAPVVGAVTTVWVTATSNADSKQQGVATVIVEPANVQALAIDNNNLPDGRTGNAYDAAFTATGGTQPYSWSVSAGNIPQGLTLTQNDGQLAGMPSAAGAYSFTVRVADAKAQAVQKVFALNIAAGGNMDGPAELPRVTVSSSMADTPAPGTTIQVNAGGDLQAALNSAHCGDTIELQAGATFTGTFVFPAKSCDSGHWVIVRSSAPDSALPAEGKRANPCFAGVGSLPGRPQYSCANPQKVMARIEYNKAADGPITFRNGANHFRLIGLEITRTAGGRSAPTLVSVEPGGVADHIVVDRSWLHGTTQDETQVGVSLNGTNYVAVVDSYFSDFHCTAGTGTCTDAHAVSGGLGDHQDGPYKIENNFLEASAEAVLFGGGGATTTPTDIEVRRNHFFKPWQWMPGNAKFVGAADGHPFIVKNHLELKNAVRVLVEANLMENNWGGFSQTGYALLLSPKNQHGQNGNLCPLCQVTDVTVRYVGISHAGGGIQLATSISGYGGNGGPALAGTRWSIHDVVMDDINKNYTGGGSLFEVQNGWPANPLNTVTINHVTGFPDPNSHLMIMGNQTTNPTMHGFVFTNNIVATGRYPVWNSGGGKTSCAYADVPVTSIATCFATYTFGNNALMAAPQAFPPSSWPAGNFFPADEKAAGFVQYNGGVGGDYELQANSPYKNAGTDGRDLGADIAGLEAALAGVE
ncbi:MAG: Ig domain-containing protein [Terriglobales bacterium]